jgi:hypothetical protein
MSGRGKRLRALIVGVLLNAAMFKIGPWVAVLIFQELNPEPAGIVTGSGASTLASGVNPAWQAWLAAMDSWVLLALIGGPILFAIVYWPWWSRRYRLPALKEDAPCQRKGQSDPEMGKGEP